MCGRKYADEHLNWAEYRAMLNIVGGAPVTNFAPNYNIAPTTMMPVGIFHKGERSVQMMHWGLVPHWASDKKAAAKMINARAETLHEKRSFAPLLASRRCVILVSGFYEWQRREDGKTPYKVALADGAPMPMAGLWTWHSGLRLASYCVITTAATPAFAAIHHRLPMILPREAIGDWLSAPWTQAQALTHPYAGALLATAVSARVNKVANNDPDLLTPVGGAVESGEMGGGAADGTADGARG
jgi:putative SOS response-associated peptidase YedK